MNCPWRYQGVHRYGVVVGIKGDLVQLVIRSLHDLQ
jgi:hypothetical protein